MTFSVTTWAFMPSDPQLAAQAHALLDRAAAHDGTPAFSEQFVLGLTDARLGHRHCVVLIDDTLAGLAAIADTDVELVIDPGQRGHGLGGRLMAEIRHAVPDAQFWAHGNLPVAVGLAREAGLSKTRRLLVMAVDGDNLVGASAAVPAGYVVYNLAESAKLYGRNTAERAWLAVNNDAFSWHPEQGGWDLDRLHRAQEANWYTDEDVLLLWHAADDEQPQLAGFHWTKWQPGVDGANDHVQGEVYVVGLSSAFRGRGLGSPIVEIGLAHLAQGGARQVILFVEDDNVAAVRRYEALGFQIAEEHVVYC